MRYRGDIRVHVEVNYHAQEQEDILPVVKLLMAAPHLSISFVTSRATMDVEPSSPQIMIVRDLNALVARPQYQPWSENMSITPCVSNYLTAPTYWQTPARPQLERILVQMPRALHERPRIEFCFKESCKVHWFCRRYLDEWEKRKLGNSHDGKWFYREVGIDPPANSWWVIVARAEGCSCYLFFN